MSSDSSGEDNVVNTTIVELFALVIFLFIIALAAVDYRGKTEEINFDNSGNITGRLPAEPNSVEDDEKGKPSPWQDKTLVFVPIFEGNPPCISYVHKVSFLEISEIGMQVSFDKFQSTFQYSLDLDDAKGQNSEKWEVNTIISARMAEFEHRFISLKEAFCRYYNQTQNSNAVFNNGECNLEKPPSKLTKQEFIEISNSMSSIEFNDNSEQNNNTDRKSSNSGGQFQDGGIYDDKWLIYVAGKDGAWDELNKNRGKRNLSSLLEFSHPDSDSKNSGTCRWGIDVMVTATKLVEMVKGVPSCSEEVYRKYGENLRILSKLNNDKGYNFTLSFNKTESLSLIDNKLKERSINKEDAEQFRNVVNKNNRNSKAFDICSFSSNITH